MSTRSIFLLSLAALTFLWASEAVAGVPFRGLPCCKTFNPSRPIPNIKKCYEQQPRYNCPNRGFLLEDKNGNYFCVDETSRWIKNWIKKGLLTCPPDISPPH